MTANVNGMRRSGNTNLFPVLLLLVVIVGLVVAVLPNLATSLQAGVSLSVQTVAHQAQLTAHALQAHGYKAVQAKNCFDRNGPHMNMTFVRPNGYHMQICTDNGKWFYQIWNPEGETVSLGAKEKMKTLEQILKYVYNGGYVLE